MDKGQESIYKHQKIHTNIVGIEHQDATTQRAQWVVLNDLKNMS